MFRTYLPALGFSCVVALASPAAVAQATDYKVLETFHGGQRGGNPVGSLVSVGNLLYGTTAFGGASACEIALNKGCGTIFSINPATRVKQLVYTFRGGQDGAYPFAALINLGGILYGTTINGGDIKSCTQGCGTVFSLDPKTGTEHIVHAFHNADGAYPEASLIAVGSTLYGTTNGGGATSCASTCGTIFSLNPKTGTEQVVHFFGGGPDGQWPITDLMAAGTTLYGTTPYGGGAAACGTIGCGTLFSLDLPTGTEKVVYRFQTPEQPESALIDVGGLLYGTDIDSLFAFNPATGAVQAVHAFQGGADGADPQGDLVNVGGTLYGTTTSGGSAFNFGTVFAFNTGSGVEQVVHVFQGGADGIQPEAGLAEFHGKLYGTTPFGGNRNFVCYDALCGTVFKFLP